MKMLVACSILFAVAVTGQTTPTVRSEFALATKAAESGNHREYLEHMQRVMTLDPDKTGRPFYQYNLARAQAMNGRHAEAIATLEAAWNERVEGPIIYFADLDPAFAETRSQTAYRKLMDRFADLEIEIAPVAGNIVEIRGAGCNLAASIGPDGVLLVDTGYARTSPAILRALKKHHGKDARVRYIVNTHGHFDHVAGNDAFGSDAVIVSHPRALQLLQSGDDYVPGFRIPPIPRRGWPEVLTDARMTIPFNEEAVQVVALPAHTDGDLIVFFPAAKVLHMGDNYFPSTSARLYPGEAVASFFSVFGPFLSTLPDDTIVLSGHDAPVPVTTLKKVYGETESLYRLVRDGVAAGKSQDALRTEGEAAGHPRRWIDFYFRALSAK